MDSRLEPKGTSSSSLPLLPEIWQAIFDDLPFWWNNVSNIRLSCKTFAILAKPMAFRYFVLYPFVNGGYSSQRFLPTRDVVARTMARLEFWASEEIACHVRGITLRPLRSNTPRDIEADGDHLLRALFQVLPRFINIREFNGQTFPIDDFAMNQLCKLGNLRRLNLDRTSIAAATPARGTLRLCNLTYTTGCLNDTNKEQDKSNTHWLLVAHPDHIQHVNLSIWYPSVAEHFVDFLVTTKTVQYLTELHMPHSDTLIRLLISALSSVDSCPLKRLEFVRSYETHNEPLSDFGSISIPCLRTYVGPHQFLLSFVPGKTIRHLHLSGLGRSEFSDPSALLYTFRHLPKSITHVKDLSLKVTLITQDVLDAIFSRCLQLEQLWCTADPTPQSIDEGPIDVSDVENSLEVRLAAPQHNRDKTLKILVIRMLAMAFSPWHYLRV